MSSFLPWQLHHASQNCELHMFNCWMASCGTNVSCCPSSSIQAETPLSSTWRLVVVVAPFLVHELCASSSHLHALLLCRWCCWNVKPNQALTASRP
ncbi:hypothetical protein VIGAN_09115000 [Vigna angularis var. angularis]|uniref:Uncharacterized protein n=1 Tax=Vigna angularis var. angularis TaxID=157739 RepID=A0A0S3SXX4_PHAAN|nr:hypothetical protein VIGAN_09115000 [Vigna angularis var. angularis]